MSQNDPEEAPLRLLGPSDTPIESSFDNELDSTEHHPSKPETSPHTPLTPPKYPKYPKLTPKIDDMTANFETFLNQYGGSPHACVKGVIAELGLNYSDVTESVTVNGNGVSAVHRNQAALIAFAASDDFDPATGKVVVFGSHTDSPCLMTRPIDNINKFDAQQVSIAPYGGGLWYTWFDRPLGVSGIVHYRDEKNVVQSTVVQINQPIAYVPSLCNHLRGADERNLLKVLSLEENLQPVLISNAIASGNVDIPPSNLTLATTLAEHIEGVDADKIVSYGLCMFPYDAVKTVGIKRDMLAAPGLDNKSSVWATLQSFKEFTSKKVEAKNVLVVLAMFDHEEIGSVSRAGADSSFLRDSLTSYISQRYNTPNTQISDLYTRSLILSVDAAHAIHPNYSEKHQKQHQPRINGGLTLKVNVNQRYATTDRLVALHRQVGQDKGIQIQEFVVKNDSPCGSTIGPMSSSQMGMNTMDIGMPIWSMHSAVESCGVRDVDNLVRYCNAILELQNSQAW